MRLPPAVFLEKYYSSRAHAANATMEEARQVLSYANEKIPRRQLIVIMAGGPETSLLNRYLEDRIREDMFTFASGKVPNKIIFISHRNVPPHDYTFLGYYPNSSPTLEPKSLKLVKAIGNLRIHEFGGNIYPFIPSSYDPDYENHFAVEGSPEISIQNIENPKAVGKYALMVKRKGEKSFLIGSPSIKKIAIKKDGAYLLFVYARKYGQASKAMLAEYNQNKWPPAMGYLNPYLGKFKIADSDFVWQAVFALSPIDKGLHNLQELIHVMDETSYFDGFQSFLLSP